LAIAAWYRWKLTPRIAAGVRRADNALARSIVVEVGLVLLIFALVAAWRFSPPPRALAIEAARPVEVHLHTPKAMADVTFTSGRPGPAQVAIVVMTGDFGGLDAKEITLSLRNRSLDVEPIVRAATKGADAVWRIDNFSIPAPGRWEMKVDILVTDFDRVSLDGVVDFK
jgi:copper transport protein